MNIKKKYIELNENENTVYQNLQDIATKDLKSKFIALNEYIRKEKRQTKPKRIRRKGKNKTINQ